MYAVLCHFQKPEPMTSKMVEYTPLWTLAVFLVPMFCLKGKDDRNLATALGPRDSILLVLTMTTIAVGLTALLRSIKTKTIEIAGSERHEAPIYSTTPLTWSDGTGAYYYQTGIHCHWTLKDRAGVRYKSVVTGAFNTYRPSVGDKITLRWVPLLKRLMGYEIVEIHSRVTHIEQSFS
ncbi:hypothetical protein ml_157 [Mollivirus sibericum]|uniref:hypothetical protein n=1 Tax=Mollivirus sibericum TaxID=1678078 RepID=UPI0006B2E69E|nr:hypothetical protein ml_157 [Mollivirus sibericum]ALD61959.1 hypothetical protein ml_157 [Mollivirus sibericum]